MEAASSIGSPRGGRTEAFRAGCPIGGYAILTEIDSIINAVTPNTNRESSPSSFVCTSGKRSSCAISSDETSEYIISPPPRLCPREGR
ncbi:hypothetical protein EVAR_85153_1 [Eumeta japonica]|uniref:Uncharacterized protein n=1 Tax=Eumeta variegata TaxID=151549 RepID=A0A4C1XUN8_EUMVA|nr:hypothetical protein EVAR_85153_1 [Eumeta japonica]